jgi:hypothetical protein
MGKQKITQYQSRQEPGFLVKTLSKGKMDQIQLETTLQLEECEVKQ